MDVDPRHTVRRPVLERDPPRRTAGTPGRERAAYAVHRYRDTPERYPPYLSAIYIVYIDR